MKVKKTFSADVRALMLNATNGYCSAPGCASSGLEFHHRVPNTVTNNKLYPLFLHSVFNCAFVCRECHSNHNHVFNIGSSTAMAFELYLKEVVDVSKKKKR